ncbi:MAG TPA: hypothetical protein VGH54_21290 [Mycobacterium sp.]|jgi:hypothetical protein|uniref:hypothetical protein n=1 Tax=Mycobacterium sp. TaxID=1785 RepID=UPI002F419C4A
MTGTKVTAEDLDTGESESHEIRDNYVLTTDGECQVTHTQVSGTTHVITVKNCLPRRVTEERP